MKIKLPRRLTAENIARFTGRTWLLAKLLDWWDKSDERLFFITGSPGTGKSRIQAWLASCGPVPEDPIARAQLERVRKAVKAVHFCDADSRNITPQAFADNVASQLKATVKGFTDALAATFAERVMIVGTVHAEIAGPGANLTGNVIGHIDLGALGDELSFDRAFTQPLNKLYATGYSESMLLLIDALDESLVYSGDKNLPKLLSTLDDLPPQVRILVTTREDPRILAFFDEVMQLDLIKNAPSDVNDVQAYAFQRLSNSSKLTQPFLDLGDVCRMFQRVRGRRRPPRAFPPHT